MKWIKYILIALVFLSSKALSAQTVWMKVGSANVGVKHRGWLNADSGMLSKGYRVLTVQDTLRGAWLSTKFYNDSLYRAHDGGSMTISGGAIKTATVKRKDGSTWMQASFTDNDNQTIALDANDTLSIVGGNKIRLPYIRGLPIDTMQAFSGVETNTFTLFAPVDLSKNFWVIYNATVLNKIDYTITFPTTLTTSFTTRPNDRIEVYFTIKN